MAVLKITGRVFSSGQGNGLHGNCIEAIGSLEAKYAHEKPVSDFLRTVRAGREIGRAHVCTPVTNAQLVCRILLEKKIILTNRTTNKKTTKQSLLNIAL